MKTRIAEIRRKRARGFTLVDLLVATAVLTLLIYLVAQLLSSATAVTTLGEKRMDADAQARAVLDRMTIDFSRMVRRPDVDYFVKSPAQPQDGTQSNDPQRNDRNDQITFYSEVPGYYPAGFDDLDETSPLSLVSYRLNSGAVELERLGKGLLWNGVSDSDDDDNNFLPMVYLPLTIKATWGAATDQSGPDDSKIASYYEAIGPQVFRFEYGYLLKGGKLPPEPSETSTTPWDTRLGHTKISGFEDVASIIVHIAVIDPKSRVLVSGNDLNTLAGSMDDFTAGQASGALRSQWQAAIDGSGLPLPARSSMRIYRRDIPLSR